MASAWRTVRTAAIAAVVMGWGFSSALALTPTPTANSGDWKPNTFYSVGAHARYPSSGPEYRCIQAHTSQVGWEPPHVPSLWTPSSSPTPTPTATPTATTTMCPTNTPPAPPRAPTNLSATAGNGQVSLTWQSGETTITSHTFSVYRSLSATGVQSRIAQTTSSTQTGSYVDTSVTNGTAYYYVVREGWTRTVGAPPCPTSAVYVESQTSNQVSAVPGATPAPSVPPPTPTQPTPTPTAVGTPWATGYMKISVSRIDPKVGESVTVTVSGNAGLGSFSLAVEGDPIFTESPAPSPQGGGTSWSWTLTAARTGTARLRASTYGETQNGCNSCFFWTSVSAAGSAVTVKSSTPPTPTPGPQSFVSNTVWRVMHDSTGDVLVRADTTNAYAPIWSIKVIDLATGLEQDSANPILRLKTNGPLGPPSSGQVGWWRFGRARAGNVQLETSVYAEFPCPGNTCYAFQSVTAKSIPQSISAP